MWPTRLRERVATVIVNLLCIGGAMRPSARLAAMLLPVEAIVILHAPSADAAVASSVDEAGLLTVTSDEAGDVVVIRCSDSGEVRIDNDPPGTGVAMCAEITAISVLGGGGRDSIDLSPVASADFTVLAFVAIDGGDGNDELEGSEIADSFLGGEGNDLIISSFPGDAYDGGSGDDRAELEVSGEVAIRDVDLQSIEVAEITGSTGPDEIDASGFSGTFRARGAAGDDRLVGGTGRNDLEGADGNDVLVGGPMQDVLEGSAGRDQAFGNGGNDSFTGFRDGGDVLVGGEGRDRFTFYTLDGRGYDVRGGPGSDSVSVITMGSSELSDDALRTPDGRAILSSIDEAELELHPDVSAAVILDASGFSGRTFIRGQTGDDILLGGAGPDELIASWGNDVLEGGPGRDLLDGFDGTDRCDGGPGRDRFIDCEERVP